MDSLPVELLEIIFSFLEESSDIVSTTGVCRLWSDIINRKCEDKAIIRYKDQQLQNNYTSLYICRPVKKNEFDEFMHDGMKYLELRMDGVEEVWDENEVKKILEDIPNYRSLKNINFTLFEPDIFPFNSWVIDYIANYKNFNQHVGIILKSKYEIFRDEFTSALWKKRKFYTKLVLIDARSYFGFFKGKPRSLEESLLDGVSAAFMEGNSEHFYMDWLQLRYFKNEPLYEINESKAPLKSNSIQHLTLYGQMLSIKDKLMDNAVVLPNLKKNSNYR